MPGITIGSDPTSGDNGSENFTLYEGFIAVKHAGEILIAKVRPASPVSYISDVITNYINWTPRRSQEPLADDYEVYGFDLMVIEITPEIHITMEIPVVEHYGSLFVLGRDFLEKAHISRVRYASHKRALNLDYLIAHWHEEGSYLSIPAFLNVPESMIKDNSILHNATPMRANQLTEEQALASKEISYAKSHRRKFKNAKPQLAIMFYRSPLFWEPLFVPAAGSSSSRPETNLQQPAPSSRSTERRPIESLSIEEDQTRSERYRFYQHMNRILDEFRWRNMTVRQGVALFVILAVPSGALYFLIQIFK